MNNSIANPSGKQSEHDRVVQYIADQFSNEFVVNSNLEKPIHYIGHVFPDLILLHKKTQKPIAIIEVKNNGNVAVCIQQWKGVQNIPALLYLIVPESELQNAKAVAQIIGVPIRFGTYKVAGKDVTVLYE